MIHGNSSAFYIDFEEIFRTIFEFWLKFNVSKDTLSDSGQKLRKRIEQAKRKTANQTGRDDKSPCSKVKGIEDIMLTRLEYFVSNMKM